MTLSLTCRNCGAVLTADDEDELATLGERHAAEHGHGAGHGSARPPSRKHILFRIRRQNPDHDGVRPTPAPRSAESPEQQGEN